MSGANEDEALVTSSEGQPWLIFASQQLLLAVDVQQVEELCDIVELTPLPRTPPFLPGLMNLRGDPIPVLDIAEFLVLPKTDERSLPADAWVSAGRIIVTHAGPFRVGLLCDRVRGVANAAEEEIHKSEQVRGGRIAEFTIGELQSRFGPTGILDLETLLGAAQVRT